MDDVAIEVVVAGGHGRERHAEVAGGDKRGVEVEGGVHAGLADGVEVDELAVVGEVVAVEAMVAVLYVVLRDHVLDEQVELAAGELCRGGGRGVDVAGVVRGLNVPPLAAEPDAEQHEGERCAESDEAAAAEGGRGLGTGGETGFADRGGDDSGHGEDEEEAEQSEGGSHAFLHVQRGDGDGQYGDGRGLRAGCAIHFDANLPGARGHHPYGAGEEGPVGGVALHGVGGGRVLRGFAGDGQRGDADAGDGRVGAADLNRGDAGDDIRRADGDVERVGACVDGLEDIFGADVSEGRGRREKEKKQDESAHHV